MTHNEISVNLVADDNTYLMLIHVWHFKGILCFDILYSNKRHSFDDVREEYFIINFISKSKTV